MFTQLWGNTWSVVAAGWLSWWSRPCSGEVIQIQMRCLCPNQKCVNTDATTTWKEYWNWRINFIKSFLWKHTIQKLSINNTFTKTIGYTITCNATNKRIQKKTILWVKCRYISGSYNNKNFNSVTYTLLKHLLKGSNHLFNTCYLFPFTVGLFGNYKWLVSCPTV
jgi:hypothetical protein